MKPSLNFIVRIVGMIGFAALGWSLGRSLSNPIPDDNQVFATQLLALAGAGLGLLVSHRITIEPLSDLIQRSRQVPLVDLFVVGAGILIGLLFGALITVPLAALPEPFGPYAPLLIAILCGYIGGQIFAIRKRDLIDLLKGWRGAAAPVPTVVTPSAPQESLPAPRSYLLDTSAIIDGRIAHVVKTGFMDGSLIVPGFVLTELQTLADASDELRRGKGRRGLELLTQMQKQSPLPIEVVNIEVSGASRVDDKLIALARELSCPIITNDFNLNKVAGIQGISVLNLNQLSEAVRPPVFQDQRIYVLIRNEGNTRQQGVGYLDDGTPVIVEEARTLIGQTVEVVISRIIQTQSGRLVFAQLVANH